MIASRHIYRIDRNSRDYRAAMCHFPVAFYLGQRIAGNL